LTEMAKRAVAIPVLARSLLFIIRDAVQASNNARSVRGDGDSTQGTVSSDHPSFLALPRAAWARRSREPAGASGSSRREDHHRPRPLVDPAPLGHGMLPHRRRRGQDPGSGRARVLDGHVRCQNKTSSRTAMERPRPAPRGQQWT
jgi:hypothetical protein